ncbi:unnamed protein product [Clonostachys rosea]|uniref:Enoyl reductase (ER) domain-containing protein n=1 Tax=Bionectria ochroleuca TaxID=29856 RepID=A0ABY6U9A4_BIOOC|nr:unnamed protein product [Clonostachys rosea]
MHSLNLLRAVAALAPVCSAQKTMRGVVFSGTPYEVTVQDLPLPTILDPTDAIVRITTTGICGTDLHMYRGLLAQGDKPYTLGHEAIGYVSEIGSSVTSLSVGDYVVISDLVTSGHLELEPAFGTFFGASAELDGLQAEYARVPYADVNLIPVPLTHNTTSLSQEQDYLLIGDIFATAWSALTWSNFEPGDTVAVFGAGPVGLLAAYSAFLRGASRVYSVDHVAQRLELAASIGAIPINFVEGDPVQQILAHEPDGVMRSVDCVGYESLNADLEIEGGIIVRQMIDVTHREGGIGIVGVHAASPDGPLSPRAHVVSPNATISMTSFFTKNLSIRGGNVNAKEFAPILVPLIASGVAHPGFISSSVIDIEKAPEYYGRFNRTEESKVFIHFP